MSTAKVGRQEEVAQGVETSVDKFDSLTSDPRFSEGNGDLSTRYPSGAISDSSPNGEDVSMNSIILAESPARQMSEFVDKYPPAEVSATFQAVTVSVSSATPAAESLGPEQRLAALVAKLGGEEVLAALCVIGPGRPAALDTEAKVKFCVMLKVGYSRSLAASQLGIHRSTISKTMQRDSVFKQEVLKAEELYQTLPLLTIAEAAQNGDWRAAAWMLKNHQPHASVENRKERRRAKKSQRDNEDFFSMSFEEMEKRGKARREKREAKEAAKKARKVRG